MAIIIEIYIREWIYSFYDPENGPLHTLDEVNYYYQYQGTVGTCVTFFFLIPTAKIIDKISPKFLLPFAYLQRAGVSFIYFWARGPKSIEFYVIAPLLHLSFFISFISLGAYLQKKFPKAVRGILTTIQAVFQQLGLLLFTLIA